MRRPWSWATSAPGDGAARVGSPMLVGTQTEQEAARRMGVVRVLVGAGGLLSTSLVRDLMGVPATYDTPVTRAMARLFGIRNVALGVWTLNVDRHNADVRRSAYRHNRAVDAIDAATLLPLAMNRHGEGRFGRTSLIFAICATLAWSEILRRLDSESGSDESR